MAQNALAGLFPRGGWNFEVANVKNALAPIMQGVKDYRAAEQQWVENERQNQLMQLNRDRFGLEQGRDSRAAQQFTREQAERDQTFPLELQGKRLGLDQARVQIGATQAQTAATMGNQRRADEMHGPQLGTAQIQYQSAKREFETPKVQSADLGPGHARVFYDRTGSETGRLSNEANKSDEAFNNEMAKGDA